jgi:hypothetical protein
MGCKGSVYGANLADNEVDGTLFKTLTTSGVHGIGGAAITIDTLKAATLKTIKQANSSFNDLLTNIIILPNILNF